MFYQVCFLNDLKFYLRDLKASPVLVFCKTILFIKLIFYSHWYTYVSSILLNTIKHLLEPNVILFIVQYLASKSMPLKQDTQEEKKKTTHIYKSKHVSVKINKRK